jgi:hypothetical protein
MSKKRRTREEFERMLYLQYAKIEVLDETVRQLRLQRDLLIESNRRMREELGLSPKGKSYFKDKRANEKCSCYKNCKSSGKKKGKAASQLVLV